MVEKLVIPAIHDIADALRSFNATLKLQLLLTET
jgi:hypothetical protein